MAYEVAGETHQMFILQPEKVPLKASEHFEKRNNEDARKARGGARQQIDDPRETPNDICYLSNSGERR